MMMTTQHNHTLHTASANKPRRKMAVVLFALLVTLIVANISIHRYETHLATGDKLLLELAPVDPRAFMQGDYMALNYAINDDIYNALFERAEADTNAVDASIFYDIYHLNIDGMAVIKKDSHMVGQFVRLLAPDELDEQKLAADELPLYFRVRQGQVKLATNAFFFQEGHGKAYAGAKYGLFRVNDKGEPLLFALVDDDFEVIEPSIPQSGVTNK